MSRQTTKSTTPPSRPVNSSNSATATTPTRKATPEQIRKRAYELFLARRGVGGSSEQDWLKAERELNSNG